MQTLAELDAALIEARMAYLTATWAGDLDAAKKHMDEGDRLLDARSDLVQDRHDGKAQR